MFKFVADILFVGFNVSLVPKDPQVKGDASVEDFGNNTQFVLGVNSSNTTQPTVTSEEDLDPCLISLQNNKNTNYVSSQQECNCETIKIERRFCGCQRHVDCFTKIGNVVVTKISFRDSNKCRNIKCLFATS